MKNITKKGFTLLEVMIVLGILAVIMGIAIPRLLEARLRANEAAAIATMRMLSTAQEQIQTSAAIDTDADGIGEYAFFGELAGTVPLRVKNFGVNDLLEVGLDDFGGERSPPLLSKNFGLIDTFGTMARSDYGFAIYLPSADNPPEGLAENSGGGASILPGANNAELYWCAYAWPLQAGSSGNRTFFVSQQGEVLATTRYLLKEERPDFDAAFTEPCNMSSPIAMGAQGQDDNTWTVVK